MLHLNIIFFQIIFLEVGFSGINIFLEIRTILLLLNYFCLQNFFWPVS